MSEWGFIGIVWAYPISTKILCDGQYFNKLNDILEKHYLIKLQTWKLYNYKYGI